MKNKSLVTNVLNLLGDLVVEYEEYYPDSITLNVVDINKEIDSKKLHTYIAEALAFQGFTDIHFNFGVNNWMTVFAKKTQSS